MDLGKQSDIDSNRRLGEDRRHSRYRLETDIRVDPRNAAVVRAHTVDIREPRISAMLRVEVPIAEVIGPEFSLPTREVDVHAPVRQRSAFR